MKKFRMVIIGATGSAYKRTIPALANSEVCSVSAVQARSSDKLKSMCQQFKIAKYYLEPKEMLDKEDFDLVYIATPPFMHFDDLSLAIKYQKPIIIEKPLARSFREAQSMAHLVSQNYSQPLMVAFHLRHQKAVTATFRMDFSPNAP